MLFSKPRDWALSAVGSWWRFAFFAGGSLGFTLFAIAVAAQHGLRAGLAAALFPVLLQLMSLLALRGLLGQTGETRAPRP
jgi:hypothetical protein